MPQDPNAMDQAVSRALRENLERIQANADELHHAVGDIVAACGSSRPTNALPAMLRAQTTAASLSAALEVLARFIAMAAQPSRSSYEPQYSHPISTTAVEPAPEPVRPHPSVPAPMAHAPAPAHAKPAPRVAPPPRIPEPEIVVQPEPEVYELVEAPRASAEATTAEEFDVNHLSAEEQELHRRANRVAKVSMQDIKMLKPDQVRLGREQKDICIRLKDDIEKAHREYDRRFKPIMDHPVDYFYRWMVEILADGDPHALGEYPYATPARQR